MNLVYGADEYVSAWVAERIPEAGDFGHYTAIGVESGGRLIAGFVFHEYRPAYGNIQVTVAADNPGWARKETMAALFSYPFVQLDCFMLYVVIVEGNDLALRTSQKAGFKRKTVLPHAFGPKRHGVVCQMLRSEFHGFYGDAVNGRQSAIAA